MAWNDQGPAEQLSEYGVQAGMFNQARALDLQPPTIQKQLELRIVDLKQQLAELEELQSLLAATPQLERVLTLMSRKGFGRNF